MKWDSGVYTTIAFHLYPAFTDLISCCARLLTNDRSRRVSSLSFHYKMMVRLPVCHIYIVYWCATSLIARFTGPTWGPSGADRTQVGPLLDPWTLLFGVSFCSIAGRFHIIRHALRAIQYPRVFNKHHTAVMYVVFKVCRDFWRTNIFQRKTL